MNLLTIGGVYNKGDGYGFIAIGVQNIYKLYKDLSENGCKVTRQSGLMKNSETILAFVKDPDGYKNWTYRKNE